MKLIKLITFLIALASAHGTASAATDSQWIEKHYTKKEVMIPMRDGIRLYTAIYQPVQELRPDGKPPVIMLRTPYSCGPYGKGYSGSLRGMFSRFVENGYVVVLQDVRGRYMSEGVYENVRAHIADKKENQTDEASDTYDTVEWIINNISTNGNVGVTGVSYPGFYATMAAIAGHPAIKAVSPQAPVLDWFMGDDAHHNGVLMLADTYSFGGSFYPVQDNPTTEGAPSASRTKGDIYSFFLKNRKLSDMVSTLSEIPLFWKEMMEHPDYDEFWQSRTPGPHLKSIKPAVLVVGGTYDTDDCYGALNTYRLIKEQSPETPLHFVYGPWSHGGWHNRGYNHIGNIFFGEGLSNYLMDEIEYPFFSYYLEGKGKAPEKVYVRDSGDTDAQWNTYNSWPPENARKINLYLREGDSLSFDRPEMKKSVSTYLSDPDKPVPHLGQFLRKKTGSYMTEDQRFASARPDVLSFTSAILTDTLIVEGNLDLKIFFSTTGTDADIVVKLIDVFPDGFEYSPEEAAKISDPKYMMGGYEMLIRGDVMRCRYRNGFDEAEPVHLGKTMEIDFDMDDIAHRFLPGHRIKVQIQSTWFPLIDINPQTFVRNLYKTEDKDYVSAWMNVFHQKDKASYIALPVICD